MTPNKENIIEYLIYKVGMKWTARIMNLLDRKSTYKYGKSEPMSKIYFSNAKMDDWDNLAGYIELKDHDTK